MKKRLAAGVLGVIMTGAMVLPVCAAEEKTQPMEVKYTQATTYTLSIPSTITLPAKGTEQANIGVKEINAAPGEKVRVSIESGITDGKVELTRKDDTSNTKVVSDVTDKDGKAVSIDSAVWEFEGMSEDPITTGILYFSAVKDKVNEDGPVKAGTYEGKIVFKGEVAGSSGN